MNRKNMITTDGKTARVSRCTYERECPDGRAYLYTDGFNAYYIDYCDMTNRIEFIGFFSDEFDATQAATVIWDATFEEVEDETY